MEVNLKVFQRGLIVVGVPSLVGILIVSLLFWVVIQTDREVARGQQFKKVEEGAIMLVVQVYHCGYQVTRIIHERAFHELPGLRDEVRSLIQLRNEHLQLYKEMDKAEYDWASQKLGGTLRAIADMLRPFVEHGFTTVAPHQAVEQHRGSFGPMLDNAYDSMQRMLAKSQKEMVETSLHKQLVLRQLQGAILLAGLTVSVVIALMLSRLFISGIVRRLDVITDNTRRLADGEPLNQPLSGSDEISEVDHSFHEMAHILAQSLERERALFNNASDVICVLNRSGIFNRVNPASLRVWGLEPEKLVGASLIEQIAPEDRRAVVESIARACSENPALEFECKIRRQDGQMIETLWSVYWAESEQSLFCVAHDISERKKLERMKQQFLAMVSHDLRSPLTSTTAVFEMLSRGVLGELPEKASDKIEMARRNIKRLLAMVNDLLDMEKLDAGQIELELESVNVQDLLERSRQEVEAVAEQRKVDVRVVECSAVIKLDRDRMIQVLVNLLSNAIKFSPEGKTVTLAAGIVGEQVEMRVTDQGRGVPASHREAIFERFKQVETADGRRKSGTGLGLPICKQMVELHGGTIGVESEEGSGSTFWIRLPVVSQVVPHGQPGAALPEGNASDPGRAMHAEEALPPEPFEDAESRMRRRRACEPTEHIDGAPWHFKCHGASGEAGADGIAAARPGIESTANVDEVVALADRTPAGSASMISALSDMSLFWKGIILVGVPVLFEFILVGLLTVVLFQADQDKAHELYLHDISYQATRMVCDYMKVGREIGKVTTAQTFAAFNAASDDLKQARLRLVELTKKDPAIWRSYQDFDGVTRSSVRFIERAQETIRTASSPQAARAAFAQRNDLQYFADASGPSLMQFLTRLDELQATSPERQKKLRQDQGLLLSAGVATNIVLSLLLVAFFSKGVTGRLAVLRENQLRLAAGEELRPPLAGRDEIAHLDRVFHQMALSLVEARQKEMAVFDHSLDVICALDRDGRFKQINSACFRLWGYLPAELLDRQLKGILSGDLRNSDTSLFGDLEDQAIKSVETGLVCKDGQIQDVLWSANWSEERNLLFCVAHDISERKELDRLKQEFLAMVSHDLRTPLTAVVGVSKLMVAGAFGELPEKAHDKLNLVIRNVNRLLGLINDLLDVEKLAAGEMQLEIEAVSAESILERSCQTLESLSRERSLNVVVEAGEGQVHADPDRLIQVVVNLLSNAIKFSPEGGTVTVSAEFKNRFCEIRVTDQGRGVPEEHREAIFERFKQVDVMDGKPGKGTGLGLPICKMIVEAHGGEIGVSSPEGIGSTFWLRLPVVSVTSAGKGR